MPKERKYPLLIAVVCGSLTKLQVINDADDWPLTDNYEIIQEPFRVPRKRAEHPHRSTTTPEKYTHLRESPDSTPYATVFFRQVAEGEFEATVSVLHPDDQFSARRGRTEARRKWFNRPDLRIKWRGEWPKYDDAEHVYIEATNKMRFLKQEPWR